MSVISPASNPEIYESALAKFEQAQAQLLAGDNLLAAAKMAGSFGFVAAEFGNLNLAEAGYRTAIHAYKRENGIATFENNDVPMPVRSEMLAEYGQFAMMLAMHSRGTRAHLKTLRLNRELLSLGPVHRADVGTGLLAAQRVANALAGVAVFGQNIYTRRADYLGRVTELSMSNAGLGLKAMVGHDLRPRPLHAWIQDIKRSYVI